MAYRNPENLRSGSGASMLICVNLMFAVCGIGIFALGVLVAEDQGRYLLFRIISPGSSILTHVATSMLGIGVSIIGSSIVGCSVAARKCSIGWFVACICLVLLAELGLGVLFLLYHNSMGSDMENTKLTVTLQSEYGVDQSLTKSMDFAQSKFNCCGVESDADFDRSEWRTRKLGGPDLIYPLTCCPLDETLSDPPIYLNPVAKNASSCQKPLTHPQHRFKEGCLPSIQEWLRKQTLTVIGMGLTLLLLQMATLATAICLCRKFY